MTGHRESGVAKKSKTRREWDWTRSTYRVHKDFLNSIGPRYLSVIVVLHLETQVRGGIIVQLPHYSIDCFFLDSYLHFTLVLALLTYYTLLLTYSFSHYALAISQLRFCSHFPTPCGFDYPLTGVYFITSTPYTCGTPNVSSFWRCCRGVGILRH